MQQIIIILHLLLCFSLIVLILLQQGKGADIGAAFGTGASQTVFGSQGSSSFLTKLTASLAALFFVTSLMLTFLMTQNINASKNGLLPNMNITGPVTNQQDNPKK